MDFLISSSTASSSYQLVTSDLAAQTKSHSEKFGEDCTKAQNVFDKFNERKGPSASAQPEDLSAAGAETRHFNFIVIGSGVAGLRYAVEVAKIGSVAIITKSEAHECNTNYAQGGLSAVLDPADSVESHMNDTIVAGAFLCNEEAVEVVCREGPERLKELIAMGASFDHNEDGQLHLTKEGAHSHRRIVHAADTTGKEIEQVLLTAVQNNPNILLFEHQFAIDFLTRQEGASVRCYGVDTFNTKTKEVSRFIAGVTVLATGGAGHIYPNTTNPRVATGDGVAMAHRACAVISNMEFVQFHPTALADEGLSIQPKDRENMFLITEAIRGAGGILYNQSMERFMPQYDPRLELAPRDIVARGIEDQLKRRNDNYVFLDISHKPSKEVLSRFPNIAAVCSLYGLDITKDPVPVVPAAHYMCGGVQTGLSGKTSVMGLYAAGEVTCTGLHGANRLASNSLLEALVFAKRAVEPSIRYALGAGTSHHEIDEAKQWPRHIHASTILDTSQVQNICAFTVSKRKHLQQIMRNYVGIVRSTEQLQIAQAHLIELEKSWEVYLSRHGWNQFMVNTEACEMRNLLCVAKIIVSSALARQESRGLHYTIDFPKHVEMNRLPTVILPSFSMTLKGTSEAFYKMPVEPAILSQYPSEKEEKT